MPDDAINDALGVGVETFRYHDGVAGGMPPICRVMVSVQVLLTVEGVTLNVTSANAPGPKAASPVNATKRRMGEAFIDLIVSGFNDVIASNGKTKIPPPARMEILFVPCRLVVFEPYTAFLIPLQDRVVRKKADGHRARRLTNRTYSERSAPSLPRLFGIRALTKQCPPSHFPPE